jgi:hypothetical protein
MPAGHRETACAIPSVGPAVFSLELVLKVKNTTMVGSEAGIVASLTS